MKRIAILIGSPSSKETPKAGVYLPGVMTDIENMYLFLTSSSGGGWKSSEIYASWNVELENGFSFNPKFHEISSILNKARNADFAFVYFSGHGYSSPDKRQKVILNQYQLLDVVDDLHKLTKRQITIIDACRTPGDLYAEGFSGTEIQFNKAFPNEARNLYEKSITKLDEAHALICAASVNQAANDLGINYGGLFSSTLLNIAASKTRSGHQQVFNIYDIFKIAKIKTLLLEPKQEPKIYGNEEGGKLPFAINPGTELENLLSERKYPKIQFD